MLALSDLRTPEDLFLDWYSSQGHPMLETNLRLGGLDYYHFSSYFNLETGRPVASFGSAINRKAAALKCAGEAIERIAMSRFFLKQGAHLPKVLHSSNGWAVHMSKSLAISKAKQEALERHLLLKTYLTHGWSGFKHIQTINADGLELRLYLARFTAEGKVAGLVATKSKNWAGISFGYCLGDFNKTQEAAFWQSAIFESVDRFLTMAKDVPGGVSQDETWIHKQGRRFMDEPFSFESMTPRDLPFLETQIGEVECYTENLNSDPTLYAAYVYGGDLIPLFWKSALDEESALFLKGVLARNGIEDIPEEHPIL